MITAQQERRGNIALSTLVATMLIAILALSGSLFAATVRTAGPQGLAALADPCTTIDSVPYTISSPGKYCLRSDLSLSAGTGAAINIQADHMVLDLNGFHLAGTAGPTSSAEGIAVGNFKSITIRNGTVSGFNNGVHLHGDYTADSWDIIEDLRVHDCTYLGIYTSGRGNVIRNNQVGHITGNPDAASGGNRLSVGIFAGGQLNRIIGNDVTDVGIGGFEGNGIMLNASDKSVVQGNRVMNSSTAGSNLIGIEMGYSKDSVVVANEVINAQVGISAYTAGAYLYRDNTALLCDTPYANGVDGGNNR